MAAISKASIRKPQPWNRVSIVWFVVVFLCVSTMGNLFIYRPSTIGVVTPNDGGTTQGSTSGSASSSKPLDETNSVVGDSSDRVVRTFDQAAEATDNSNVSPFKNPGGGSETFIYHNTLKGPEGHEGSVVLDMMMAHAYTFNMAKTYGGSCGAGNDVGRAPENSLINSIGLQKELRFECPYEGEAGVHKKTIPSSNYMQEGVRSFTPEYATLLKSVTVYPTKTEQDKFTIVVHIARGKTSPCRSQYKGFDPYLPNQHYQMLIDKYMKPNARVIVYSQRDSFEGFDEFRDKGYELHIEEPIGDVWKNILLADVVIMSRSSFSYAPAIVSKGTVVYTPFWHKPLRGWDVVGKDVLEKSEVEFQRLKSTCKPSADKWAKFRKNQK